MKSEKNCWHLQFTYIERFYALVMDRQREKQTKSVINSGRDRFVATRNTDKAATVRPHSVDWTTAGN